MAQEKPTPDFSEEEAQRRFEQTLHGALSTPPKPLKNVAGKRKKPIAKKKAKPITKEEDAAITAAALTDPDNPPLTQEQLAKARPASEAIPHIVEKYGRSRKKGS